MEAVELPTRSELEAMLEATEQKWRRARLLLSQWEREFKQLTRSQRRSRAGAVYVGRLETTWAVLVQLRPVLAGVREALGLPEPDALPARTVPCECLVRPSKVPGLDEVVWSDSCPLHGHRR